MTVDDWVAKHVPVEYRALVAEVRVLLTKNMPGVTELISYNMPVYRYEKPVAWINAGKKGISVGFRNGTEINDRYGLLRGAGKGARNVSLKDAKDLNTAALRDYIQQAVKLDRAR